MNALDFKTTAEAAEIMGLKKGTLEVWRYQGKGPLYLRLEDWSDTLGQTLKLSLMAAAVGQQVIPVNAMQVPRDKSYAETWTKKRAKRREQGGK